MARETGLDVYDALSDILSLIGDVGRFNEVTLGWRDADLLDKDGIPGDPISCFPTGPIRLALVCAGRVDDGRPDCETVFDGVAGCDEAGVGAVSAFDSA